MSFKVTDGEEDNSADSPERDQMADKLEILKDQHRKLFENIFAGAQADQVNGVKLLTDEQMLVTKPLFQLFWAAGFDACCYLSLTALQEQRDAQELVAQTIVTEVSITHSTQPGKIDEI